MKTNDLAAGAPCVVHWHWSSGRNAKRQRTTRTVEQSGTALVLGVCGEHLRVVRLDVAGVVVRRVDAGEAAYMRPAEYHGKPYPVARMARALRTIGRAAGGLGKTTRRALAGL